MVRTPLLDNLVGMKAYLTAYVYGAYTPWEYLKGMAVTWDVW